jgi:hypothetical protein
MPSQLVVAVVEQVLLLITEAEQVALLGDGLLQHLLV